jgi:hypothetical protein
MITGGVETMIGVIRSNPVFVTGWSVSVWAASTSEILGDVRVPASRRWTRSRRR